MSWLFSQALVAAYSEANCSDGAQSAPSNTTPTPQAFLSRDKTTDAWSRFPSGMTCEPLTESRGEELLTWFRAGFLVRTLVPAGRAQASTEKEAECGHTWPASFAKYDHHTHSWKTPQYSLLEGLDEFSETWPKWGIMRNGACWAQTMPAPATEEKEFGFVPTLLKSDAQGGGTQPQQRDHLLQSARLVGRTRVWKESAKQAASVLGMVNGVAPRLDGIAGRIGCCGNGQVPAVAALAWRLLGGPDGDCGGPR